MAQKKAPSPRQLKVGEELRHLISSILQRGDLRHPNLLGKIITVTEVKVSPDLRHANAFVMPLGGEKVAEVLEGLSACKGFIKREIGSKLRLKFMPEIHFSADTSFEKVDYIEGLLRRPEVARDLKAKAEDSQEAE